MVRKFLAAFCVVLFAGAGAHAAEAPLTADAAKRFVASLDSVEQLGKELEAEGKTQKLAVDHQPKPGEPFKPYSTAVKGLKEDYPADYARLRTAVKPHGFNADTWSETGDRVMVAYLAIKMEEENPGALQQMQAMDASMLDMMPPEMKAQFQQAMTMMETVKNAPADDKKAVATVKDDLDAYMERTAPPAAY